MSFPRHFRRMATTIPSDPYEAADASLREKEARLAAELEAVRNSRAAIAAARVVSGVGGNGPSVAAATAAMPIAEKFRGLGLEQASAKVLSESDRLELTAKQIWGVLASAGFSLLSDKPEQSVSWALRKREKKVGDVILTGDGRWGMVDWYSQARLKELRASRNNASTRNSAEHIDKTKAGIANAKRNRLEHWGRRRSVTGEQMAKAYEAIQNGASKLAASKAAGIAHPTFAWYWKAFEMENWKPGLPFPPTRRAVENKTVPKKHEMWPRESGRPNGNGIVVGSTTPH
jgi:hypothetical protein